MNKSLFANISYVYHLMFQEHKKLKWILILFILVSIVIPILGTVVPSVVIAFITGTYGIKTFLWTIAAFFLVYGLLLFLENVLVQIIEVENTIHRLMVFYIGLSRKLMTTDYVNVEPHDKQIEIQKAITSLSSNWVGLEFLMKNTPTLLINFIGLVLYSAFISSLNWVIILVLVIMSIVNYSLNNYAQKYDERHKKAYSKLDQQITYLSEQATSLVNGKDVRLYQMNHWFHQLFRELTKKRVRLSRNMEIRYTLPVLSDSIFLCVRDLIAYSILLGMVLNHQMTVATFTLYVGVIAGFGILLSNTVTAYSNLKRANLGVNDYRHYMELADVFNHEKGMTKLSDGPLEIEFKNVSFRYPGATEETIKNLSLKIKPRSKVAIVGNNGAGKTTFVKLLSGLYYPTEGEILVGGKSIKDYNLDEYHKLVGVVFQEVEILAFSILQNIACGESDHVDSKKLSDSIQQSGLFEKVQNLTNHEKTYLTQAMDPKGIQLSGGEMQKLMLARALYKNAPLIILDEPTSALDPLAEAELYEKYHDLTKNQTSIFISHRLSSTQFCDRILFIEKGQIVEDGTHQELMNAQGEYAKMFDIQSHYYKKQIEEEEE